MARGAVGVQDSAGLSAVSERPAEARTPTEILDLASKGLARIRELSRQCNIPAHLRDFNIPESAIERMARGAMTVTRLLERNVREVKLQDAIDIYRRAF
jgi:alcohol dehydrogenase class IV